MACLHHQSKDVIMAKAKQEDREVAGAIEHLESRIDRYKKIYVGILPQMRGDRAAATAVFARDMEATLGFSEVAAFDIATAVRMLVEADNAR
jgi:hypothetical protein